MQVQRAVVSREASASRMGLGFRVSVEGHPEP